MVSDLNRSRNLSKMKSTKSNNRSRRNKLSMSLDQGQKSPKKEQSSSRKNEIGSMNRKIKSGSWKRTTCLWDLPYNSKLNKINDDSESEFPSLPTKSQPGVLYSEVLFNGEKLKTPVKIKNLTPRHSLKINSRGRKRLISVDRNARTKNGDNCNLKNDSLNTAENPENANIPKSSDELEECVNKLMQRLNIDILPWNFEDYANFNENQEYICRFEDYNYLACENVALVGLRLASDGKFRY